MNVEICKLCGKPVPEGGKMLHREVEAMMLGVIRKRHPDWVQEDGMCPDCFEELKRMAASADDLEVQ